MKKIGYLLFAALFYIGKVIPVNKKQMFLIMTHDPSEEGNVRMVAKGLQAKGVCKQYTITREDELFYKTKNPIKMLRFFGKAFQMARSKYILLDNVFLPMAYMRFSDSVKVVQLWHGTGTIKRFGQDVNRGDLKRLEKKSNQNITHLIVNSDSMKTLYAKCFGIRESKVYALGLPRTDLLFDQEEIKKKQELFYVQFPELKNKKIILYAPTFRDNEIEQPSVELDTNKVIQQIKNDYIIGLRLHPHISRNIQLNLKSRERIFDFSNFSDLNTLLSVTDILITDYSSIIFEFALFQRPMLFYAYDYNAFSDNGRGFYDDYKKTVPGKVVYTVEEMIQAINMREFGQDKINQFVKKNYKYLDGKSVDRIIDILME